MIEEENRFNISSTFFMEPTPSISFPLLPSHTKAASLTKYWCLQGR